MCKLFYFIIYYNLNRLLRIIEWCWKFLFSAMMLQESDMFMDALTASTKSKEPRKRKRRTSITKDGSSEAKKQETANADNCESTPPPASPTNVEEKSSVALKPNFKVIISVSMCPGYRCEKNNVQLIIFNLRFICFYAFCKSTKCFCH